MTTFTVQYLQIYSRNGRVISRTWLDADTFDNRVDAEEAMAKMNISKGQIIAR